jgi:hypothetical protein
MERILRYEYQMEEEDEMTPADVRAYVKRHELERHISKAVNAAVRVAHPQPLSCIADLLEGGTIASGSGKQAQTPMAARAYALYYKLQQHLFKAINHCVYECHEQPLRCIADALRRAEAGPPIDDSASSELLHQWVDGREAENEREHPCAGAPCPSLASSSALMPLPIADSAGSEQNPSAKEDLRPPSPTPSEAVEDELLAAFVKAGPSSGCTR